MCRFLWFRLGLIGGIVALVLSGYAVYSTTVPGATQLPFSAYLAVWPASMALMGVEKMGTGEKAVTFAMLIVLNAVTYGVIGLVIELAVWHSTHR